MLFVLFAVLVLLTVAAFFSVAETALTTASKPLMHQLDEEGDARAGTVVKLLDEREEMISTVLLGNNLVNILASALTTSLMIDIFGSEGVFYATAIMTVLVVIYGEILPKTYALLYTTSASLKCAGVMYFLMRLFKPFNAAIEYFVNGALRMFKLSTTVSRSAKEVLAELRGAIEVQMADKQIIHEVKLERAMLRSVLDLAEYPVSDVMVHRQKLVTIDADLPIEQIIEQVAASPYSRIPLWREQPDNIVGLIHAKALLRALESADGKAMKVDVVGLAIKPWFVPATTTLLDQLNAFRARREHFAMVIDEYGTILGALTLEDILEEIVGDIRDEHDVAVAGVRRQTNGSFLIDGSVTLRDLNREFDWDLPDDKASTIAGLVLYEARTIPETGQKFLFHGFRFEVLRRARNQLTLMRVTPPQPKDESASEAMAADRSG
ncbi:MAG: HlyC/CorC family transporter [Rhodospirillaceae bacterium]